LPHGVLLNPFGDFTVVQEVFVSKVYNRLIEPRDGFIVVDVGAHVGSYTLLTARKIRSGWILAVEPELRNYKLLTLNIALNHLRNVISIRSALSFFEGSTKLYLSTVSREHSTVPVKGRDTIEVPVTTLDKLIKRIGHDVDLIKIDVEGAEREVLQGAENTLRQPRLNIVLAAYHTPTQAEELENFLKIRSFTHVKRYYIDDTYAYIYARK
jgi:FkbM family methyltransferase